MLFCKFWTSSKKSICSTVHFQHRRKLASYLLQSTPSEDCLLIRKNTSLEITKTVELKIVMLLVMKNIWSSVKPLCKNMSPKTSPQNYVQTNCPSFVPMLFKTIGITLGQFCLKVILRTRDIVRGGFPDSLLQYGRYIQAVIVFQCFFL